LTNKPDKYYEAKNLIKSLQLKHQKLLRERKLVALFLFMGIAISGFAIFAFLEQWNYFPPLVKSVSLFATIILSLFSGYFAYKKYTLDDFFGFYRTFFRSKKYPELLHAIDLFLYKKENNSPFYELAIQKNLEKVNRKKLNGDLAQFTSGQPVHKFMQVAVIVLLTASSMFSVNLFTNNEAVERTVRFWEEFEKPNPFTYTISPESQTMEHGNELVPEIKFIGMEPNTLFLALKTGIEDEFRLRPMQKTDSDSVYRAQPLELTSNAVYKIIMDEFDSKTFQIDVQLRPRFESLTAIIQPPVYTGLSGEELEYPFTRIPAYRGSVIRLEASSNKPIQHANIIRHNVQKTLTDSLDTANEFEYSFVADTPDTIRFSLTDSDNLTNKNPFKFNVDIREDERPSAVIREPESNLSITDPKELNILYQATDDFGLTKARLEWELARAIVNQPVKGNKELKSPAIGRSELVEWNLESLELRPRDEVTFWIRVWDNDEITGFKSGTSQKLVLTVPSMTAYFEEIDSKEREVQDRLEDVSENYENMLEEFNEFLEDLKQKRDHGWEEQQKLEELEESQKKIEETVQELNKNFEELRKEIEQNNNLSEETQRTYRELQQLMEELDDPSLRKAMEELRKSLERMSPQQMEQALQNLDFNEEVYRERLKRTLELFKTLKLNSDLDKISNQFENIAERLDETEESEKPLESLKNELESGRDDLDKINDQVENLDQNPPEKLQDRLKELKESTMNELMEQMEEMSQMEEEAGDQLQDGQSNPGEQLDQQRQQMAREMRVQSEKMQQAMQQMSGQQIQINLMALQRSLYTLLELSQSQETLTRQAAEIDNRSQAFVDLARKQKNVRDQFSQVADTLFQVSSEIPGLSNQINKLKSTVEINLQKSTDQMAERDRRSSSIAARESMGGINNLSSMIASLIDQLMNQQQGGGGSGGSMTMQQMIEQMQKMSGDQQRLNEQMEQLINDIQGERLTREQSERLEQLARQQNEIRKQLQKLQQSGALKQGDRALSEMQRMIEEMEDSINDMRGGMTDPLMQKRQENILSRMLNAEKSLQERGEDEEREGDVPKGFDQTIPPDITLEELKQEIRSRLQDPNYTRFRQDYQRMIERYFELLRRLEGTQVP